MSNLWVEILTGRAKAHQKHGANSIEAIPADDPRWLSILVEEIGEVAHAMTYDSGLREMYCKGRVRSTTYASGVHAPCQRTMRPGSQRRSHRLSRGPRPAG